MCRRCGDPDCKNGDECHLDNYVNIPAVAAAIRRVHAIDPTFTARSYGSQQYHFAPTGVSRPAANPAVWARFQAQGNAGYRCPYCQRQLAGGYEVDHITPWRNYIRRALGLGAGADGCIPLFVAVALASDPANLQVICDSCNASKGDLDPSDPRFPAWRAGRQAWGQQQMGQQPQAPPPPQGNIGYHQTRSGFRW